MSEQRLPTEIPARWEPGQQLYQRQRAIFEPLWSELDEDERRVWRDVEAYVALKQRLRVEPGAVIVERETAIERYERHVQAVQAVLVRCLESLGGDEWDVKVVGEGEWLRRFAEDVLAAADTGI